MTITEKQTTSKDGTKIGYRQSGSGPGLVICHGGGRVSQNYQKLAAALADTFTVYVYDRRGRGLSGPATADYDMSKAIDDLSAVIASTGACFIFGHSSGGLIALETMLLKPLQKLAVYEPPVSVNHSLPSAWLPDFEKALSQGRVKQAMAISLKGLQVQQDINRMPFWCLLLLISVLALAERKKEKGTRMLDLLHTLQADMKMAMKLDSCHHRYQQISNPVLLMGGSKSPAYFNQGLHALEKTLPRSEMTVLDSFDHYSPEENVQEISSKLKAFFIDK